MNPFKIPINSKHQSDFLVIGKLGVGLPVALVAAEEVAQRLWCRKTQSSKLKMQELPIIYW